KGLDQVVVGAGVQAKNPVLDGVFRSEDEYRRLNTELAQSGEHVHTVAPRKHEVEEYQVKGTLACQKESFFAGRGARDLVMLGFKAPSQRPYEFLLVLDDQNAQYECPALAGPERTV